MAAERFPISFDRIFKVMGGALLFPPSSAYVEVDELEVRVQMSWGFRARFARSSVVECSRGAQGLFLGIGVHGWRGRWLVNGGLSGLVTLHLSPEQQAYVLGVPVRLHTLQLSLEAPDAFLARMLERLAA